MKNRAISLILITVMLLGLLCGCGEAAPATEPAATAPVDNGLDVALGQTLSLSADTLSGEITWSSSNPELAAVDADGVVTAFSDRGDVTVTATAGDKTQEFEINLCAQTAFGAVHLPSGDGKLTIGVWNGSYHEIDDFRMELLADAGISLLIGLEERWLVNYTMEEMLDMAQVYGISVLEDMRDWDGVTVPEYTDHPALAGYLLFDEPNTLQYEQLTQLKEKFDAVMPEDKLFYVNLFPMACAYESLYGNDYDRSKVDYEKHYIDPFIEAMELPYISYDAYALQEGGLIRPSYYRNFDIVANACQQTGRDLWYTLLSAPHSTTDGRYIDPGQAQLRWQMALGMTYGSKDLAHYILCSHDEDYTTMIQYGSWEPTRLYDDISVVNNEFLLWDDIYTSYSWKGVATVDTGTKNAMLEQLTYTIPLSGAVSAISSDQDLLAGIFEKDGCYGYMLTNAGDVTEISGISHQMNFTMTDANVTLTLAPGSYQCVAVISRGQVQYLPVTADNTVSLTVAAYDGVFVIPVFH